MNNYFENLSVRGLNKRYEEEIFKKSRIANIEEIISDSTYSVR